MSVLVVPGDSGGCGFYRMRAPAEACRDVGGMDVVIEDAPMTYAAQPLSDGTVRVVHIDTSTLPDVDTIVLQRPLGDTGWQFVQQLRAKGFRLVVDVDDDFDRLHPHNPAARQCNTDPRFDPRNIHRAIAAADACTVSTPALFDRYGRNGTPTTILRNMVPAWYLTVDVAKVERSVGWTGTVATHHNDLGELGGALGTLQREGWAVHVIGRADRQTLGCVREPIVTEWQPLGSYPNAVATFDVGIVPLRDTQFNRGKSWLKGLEYAALGVPFAASALPEYRELHALGIGRLVHKSKHWAREIRAAFDGDVSGRSIVRDAGLTYEDRWQDWATVWTG